MRRIFSPISLAALATATVTAMPASAQVSADPAPAATEATAVATATPGAEPGVAEPAVADIVVTAQRRSESLKDVPVSVATIDSQTLAAISAGGNDIRALSGRVPSLNIESSFGRTFPRFYIRGLGNTDFDLNASQPVSLVYDDVVLENPILKGFPVFDVNQVEVLRGPQGTLFGRNTPAGIVKFDTVRPGHGGNYAKISYGSYDTINAEAGVGAKLGDDFSVRLSGLYQHRKNWIDNVATPGKNDLEGYDDIAGRLQLQYRHDALTVRATGQIRDYDGSARVFRANLFSKGSNQLNGLGGPGTRFQRDKVRNDGLNFQRLRNYNAGLSVDYDAGPVTFYSITSYWNGNLHSRGDIDGGFGCSFCGTGFSDNSSPGFIPFPAQSEDDVPSLDQFTQEFRVASNNKTGLGYQAGVFYFNEKLDIVSLDFPTPTSTTPDAIAVQRQDSDAVGVFGSVNYKFDNGLTLQGGARWNHDKRDFKASRPLDTRQEFLGFGGPVAEQKANVKASVVTWDASATYPITPEVNLYARVARGYRAPSIQGRLVFGRSLSIAKSEKTMSYEGGFKAALLDNRLRFNADLYWFDTKDLQLTAVGGASNFTTLLNADHVKGHGVEIEMQARPARGFTLSAGMSYNKNRIDSPGLGVAGCSAACTVLNTPISPGIYSIDGNQLPQSPKWILNWTAGYETPAGPGSVYFFTDWYYRSKIQFFLYRSVEFSDDEQIEGGLRVGYKTDRFDVAGFVRNLTNDQSAVGGIDFNNLTGFVNEPRIFGVEAGIKF